MNLYELYNSDHGPIGSSIKVEIVPALASDALRRNGSRDPRLERAVSKSAHYAFHYAQDTIRGRWPLGEPAIASNPQYAFYYAHEVIKGRWPEGETAMAMNGEFAYRYAVYVLKGRFKAGERAVKAIDWWDAYEDKVL